jgi:hypothetical protein
MTLLNKPASEYAYDVTINPREWLEALQFHYHAFNGLFASQARDVS